MITKDNLKQVLTELESQDVHNTMSTQGDYIAIELHVFNVGAYSTMRAIDPNSEEANEIIESGDMVVSKDDFLMLYKESGAHNPHIEEYL